MKPDLSEDDSKLLLTEVEALSKVHHLNIVNVLRYGNDTFVKTSGKTKPVNVIVLELAQGGEFFDFIAG